MSGLFAGTPLERPVTCERCEKPLDVCECPRDASGRVVIPSDQRVRIRTERRRNKLVTIVEGLDPDASDLKAIVKTLRAKCGAGGTVTRDAIEVQGEQREVVAGVLASLGYELRKADRPSGKPR